MGMCYRIVNSLLCGSKNAKIKPNGCLHVNAALYHCSEHPHEETLSSEWYNKAYNKLTKLTLLLRNLDMVDGRVVDLSDNSTVYDELLEHKMHTFKVLARAFVGCPSMQWQALQYHINGNHLPLFSKPGEREPITVNSLTKICNFLNISAQQRKDVRLTICPQVTQHQIWTGALQEILIKLESEMDSVDQIKGKCSTRMGRQIIASCLKVLDTAISYDPESTSWMRLAPTKCVDSQHKWEDVLEMFNDLISCLRNERMFLLHQKKLEVMREGLMQIKDVLLDKSIGYKEIRHQESLVQKKLTKTLGHSSQCLFTLLNYYMYGNVRDIEVELHGGVYDLNGGDGNNNNRMCLCMGKILTSDEERMVLSGVKQLNNALGLFKFVWEAAGMKTDLELQGHLWYVGSKNRSLKYRENMFFLHGISL